MSTEWVAIVEFPRFSTEEQDRDREQALEELLRRFADEIAKMGAFSSIEDPIKIWTEKR